MPYALCLVYQVRQPVTMADFLEALSKISKSVGAEDILKHQKWMREFGAT
jgi:katanin p60 ATPase-containing subunit A1